MKRLIFLDTNWILGEEWKKGSRFPSIEFKNLIKQKNELDQIIILPTVFDELANKVGWAKVNQFEQEYDVKIIQRIVNFPYEVFTRIRNRHADFFKKLMPDNPKSASYKMSNDFLIMNELLAIVHDQKSVYGIAYVFLLTHDDAFQKMIKKLKLKIDVSKTLPPVIKNAWEEQSIDNNKDLENIAMDIAHVLERQYVPNILGLVYDTCQVSGVWVNSLHKRKTIQKEYKLEALVKTTKGDAQVIVNFLVNINKGKKHVTPLETGKNFSFYHLWRESAVLALLKNYLSHVYKKEKDWWVKTYFMQITEKDYESLIQ